ncbi:type 1 glutamine amidotransferase domain-containing protein [Angustibacter sp. McL0619]|uniref:type 1 glutamine amidotransferase domain-containing protein n=1 Tax=Angustibacter sp. McL0619 TaxID=3415676 RepID=UPI003CE8B192
MSKGTILFALTSHAELGDTGRTTGAYAPEFAHPARVFQEAGYDIAFVSVRGGRVPLDGLKDDDTITRSFLADEWVAQSLESTPIAADLDPADYSAIYYAGGHGAMWDLPGDRALAGLAAAIYDGGGVVAAVCHGPAGLVNLRLPDGTMLVEGKRVSSFTDDEEAAVGLTDVVPFLLQGTLEVRGAKHEQAENFSSFAVSDQRLVTGQNPASAVRVAELTLEALG